jgi:hypothetical protein
VALDVELAHPGRLGGVGDPAIKRNHVLYVPVPMSFCSISRFAETLILQVHLA